MATPIVASVRAAARAAGRIKTGVTMLNLGGPANAEGVAPFLRNLFSDRDIIRLPMQKYAAQFITWRRTDSIIEQYKEIGGGSPIGYWTQHQGAALADWLDEHSPESGPHQVYVGFRYAPPFTKDALDAMHEDGVENAVFFSQYPQYSCSTTGSSLNEIYRQIGDGSHSFKSVSVVDRWGTHPALVSAIAGSIREAMGRFSADERDDLVVLFSAHSLPVSAHNKGDPYMQEVAATVDHVMTSLGSPVPHRLVWQSQVGPQPWLEPKIEDALKGLAEKGRRNVIVVPVAFTSDHVETLFEIDIEYGTLAEELGIKMVRSESLNLRPELIRALGEVVHEHIRDGFKSSAQLPLRCFKCVNDVCGQQKQFFTAA